jgi:hypothetical protein
MPQGKPSSLSSKLRVGGRALLYAQPVHKAATFKPSGDPERDPPEVAKDGSWFDTIGRALDLDTPEGRARHDAKNAGPITDRVIRENQFWEKRRFKQGKSLRAKKRELQREAKKKGRAS